MEITTSIGIQAAAIALALLVTILRIWVRLRLEHRTLTAPDYLVWCGWLFTLGWFICSIKALNLGINHPVHPVTGATDSVEYLKTVFVACFFFDIGLYWPKASIIVFYWCLIPPVFERLRLALYITCGYVVAAFTATVLTDTLMTQPISNNWSLDNQLDSLWNSATGFIINWILNITTDLLLFCLPFSILECLTLNRRQKIGLVGVFSLGLITMVISTVRFITYIVTQFELGDATGNAWCTIEMSTAVIVVSLPGLKSLLVHVSTPNATIHRRSRGYLPASPRQPTTKSFASRSRSQPGDLPLDDEVELISYGQSSSLAGNMTLDTTSEANSKNAVMVTTDFTVTRALHKGLD